MPIAGTLFLLAKCMLLLILLLFSLLVATMSGDPKEAPVDLVVRPGADGRQRHRAGASDVLVPRSETLPGAQPGKTCRIAAGRHEGLDCKVLELLPVEEGRSGRRGRRSVEQNMPLVAHVLVCLCQHCDDLPCFCLVCWLAVILLVHLHGFACCGALVTLLSELSGCLSTLIVMVSFQWGV